MHPVFNHSGILPWVPLTSHLPMTHNRIPFYPFSQPPSQFPATQMLPYDARARYLGTPALADTMQRTADRSTSPLKFGIDQILKKPKVEKRGTIEYKAEFPYYKYNNILPANSITRSTKSTALNDLELYFNASQPAAPFRPPFRSPVGDSPPTNRDDEDFDSCSSIPGSRSGSVVPGSATGYFPADCNAELNGAIPIHEESNAMVPDDSQFQFSWLQCTRYRPPKLSRSKRCGDRKRKLGRNPRVPFSQGQVAILELKFRQAKYLSSLDVADISRRLDLTENRVKIWFQNRRARERREKASIFVTNGLPAVAPDDSKQLVDETNSETGIEINGTSYELNNKSMDNSSIGPD